MAAYTVTDSLVYLLVVYIDITKTSGNEKIFLRPNARHKWTYCSVAVSIEYKEGGMIYSVATVKLQPYEL
jgi:hypothetical protein